MSMIIKTNSNDKYFKSQDVRVFPCTYRGYYNKNTSPATSVVFDPEARATTESNFTEAFHKLSPNKESYIVNWDSSNSVLKCVIGGYYFEIRDCTITDFFWDNNGLMTPYYLCINTKSVQLGTSEPDESNSRETRVLSSFDESTDYLDIKYNDTDYVFTGLLVSTTDTGTTSFQPFKATKNEDAGTYEYSIDNTQLPITNILDSGEGNCSLRMINNTEDSESGKVNTTEASGDSSVALGKGTKATAEAAMATGDHTEAKAKGAFSGGVKTKASAEGAVSLGSNTQAKATNSLTAGSNLTADKENQVVFGQYNTKDENQAFIIANGTGTTATSNKFTVGYEGNIRALGNLEIKGSIKATGASTNDLELGTTSSHSSGSIKVYGTGADAVFSVTESGNTTISGTTSITGSTTIAGFTTITKDTESNSTTSGALKVSGGAGISKNLNVGGTFTVGDGKATTLGGAVTVKGNTELQGTLTSVGSTTLNDTLTVEKLTTLKAGATITGDLSATGKANITGKVTAAKTTEEDTDNTLTTKDYVDAAKTAANTYTDNEIKNLDVGVPSVAEDDTGNKGDGSYLKTITQTDGKIAATKVKFATTLDSTNDSNASTSKAVATYVAETIKRIWIEDKVQKTSVNSEPLSLQAIVLDAVYPVGSIYMQYVAPSAATPSNCPLENTLPGSTWELIEDGVFLRSVGEAYDNKGDTGGSANAVVISHTHDTPSTTIDITDTGKHSHSVTKRGTAHDGGDDDTFRTAQSDKGGKKDITWSISSSGAHSHSITVPSLTTSSSGEDGIDKNLPPYLYVYMWKRTA